MLVSDIGLLNLMMDESAVIPGGTHFCRPWTHDGQQHIHTWCKRCIVASVNYYYIDFGLSSCHPGESLHNAVALGSLGQVKTVPELSDTVAYNPYKADVYQLGYTFLEVIQVST